MALATVFSRVLGFVRDAMVAACFGAGFGSDAFLAAFRIPNLFRRLVGEGALNSAFVPVFTEALYRGGHAEADRLFGSALRAFGAVLLIVSAAGVLVAHWIVPVLAPGFPGPKLDLTITLTRLMLPYLFGAGMAALCMGVLNVYGSFAPPALAPALLNLCMIGSLAAIAPHMERPVIGLAAGVLIGGAAQLLFQMPFLKRRRLHFWGPSTFARPALARMARLMVPAVFGGAVYQINILVGTLLASMLAEGSISYLYYAERLAEFPLGVAAVAGATAALPSMAREAAAGNTQALAETFAFAFRLVSFVTIPAMAGLILLGEPMVALLFMRGEFGAVDVRLTVQALSYYAIGLWAFAAVRIAVATCFALQDSRAPLAAAACSVLANILLGLVFMKPMAHGGMALATSLASLLNLAILLTLLRRRIEGVDWRSIAASLVRSFLSAGIMAAGVLGISRLTPLSACQRPTGLAAALCAAIGGGAIIYFAASRALGSTEAGDLLAHLRRRAGSR